jgi:hypothetical protein
MKLSELTEFDLVVCKTPEEIVAFEKFLHLSGKTWCNGQSYIEDSVLNTEEYKTDSRYKEAIAYVPRTGSYSFEKFYGSIYRRIPFSSMELDDDEYFSIKVIEDI